MTGSSLSGTSFLLAQSVSNLPASSESRLGSPHFAAASGVFGGPAIFDPGFLLTGRGPHGTRYLLPFFVIAPGALVLRWKTRLSLKRCCKPKDCPWQIPRDNTAVYLDSRDRRGLPSHRGVCEPADGALWESNSPSAGDYLTSVLGAARRLRTPKGERSLQIGKSSLTR